jgi:PAS domain S-box-containing protein
VALTRVSARDAESRRHTVAPALAYPLAVAAVGVIVGLRLALDPLLGQGRFAYAPLFVAVLWASAYGGVGPGLFAALVGAATAARFLVPPRSTFAVGGPAEPVLDLAVYLAVSAGIVTLATVMRQSQVQAEEMAFHSMKDSEQLRITLASIGDGVIVTDEDGLIASMNPVAERLTGFREAQGKGRPLEAVFRIVSESTREGLPSPVDRVRREGGVADPASDTILVAREGQRRFIDDTASPIRGEAGEILGVVLVFREIGERRRSEELQRRLASIVENSDDAIIGKTLDGTITSWNAGAERLYGYAAEEVLGKPSAFMTPGDRLGEQSAVLVKLRDRAVSESFETVRRAKDGRLIDVSVSMAPIRDEAGNVIGSSTIARDITQQKRAAEEIRRLNLDLEKHVADRKRAEETLREADRNKNEFLAVLAHELRNPLAPLLNALAILKRPEAGGGALVEARDMAERQVHHLSRLVDDLLDVSRITHGKIELRKEAVELSTAVARAVETALPAIEAQGHRLTVSLPENPIWLRADLVRIAQVFANLLNNSAKYTTPGGKISLRVEKTSGHAVIRVTDTGVGIGEAALTRVFEMFAQAGPPDSRSPMSLGVGLRLVKSLVELHGGSVEASSAGPGKGSEFVVALPTIAAPPSPEVAPPPGSQSGPPRRVLVVDDNADGAASLAMLLKLEGHEAQVAHSGEAALESVERRQPDVVFLDIGMPGMDGYEVARRLRSRPGLTGLKIIALTGWGQEHDRQRARDAGFDHHLTKPVALTDLHALLSTVSQLS